MIHISTYNEKLGFVSNISLPPGITCGKEVECRNECYALRITKRFRHVVRHWQDNLDLYREDPDAYFQAIYDHKCQYFRFHVGGDCPDMEYVERLKFLARAKPKTKFLLYTKRYDLFSAGDLSSNLSIVFSVWPYMKLPEMSEMPRAFLSCDPKVKYARNPVKCVGKCDSCYYCWKLGETGADVILKPH